MHIFLHVFGIFLHTSFIFPSYFFMLKLSNWVTYFIAHYWTMPRIAHYWTIPKIAHYWTIPKIARYWTINLLPTTGQLTYCPLVDNSKNCSLLDNSKNCSLLDNFKNCSLLDYSNNCSPLDNCWNCPLLGNLLPTTGQFQEELTTEQLLKLSSWVVYFITHYVLRTYFIFLLPELGQGVKLRIFSSLRAFHIFLHIPHIILYVFPSYF